MVQDLAVKNMNELTAAQFASLQNLTVSAHQEVLGKSFNESIEDWRSAIHDQVLGLCFLIEVQPVGLTLIKKQPSHSASIHGLKISTPWQGRGLGHRAFRLAVDHLKIAWPDVTLLELAVDAENLPAITIYRAAGMSDSGPVFQGPNGREHHMKLQLKA
jgi:RimJ/RimL family protein N-acetyltransferase